MRETLSVLSRMAFEDLERLFEFGSNPRIPPTLVTLPASWILLVDSIDPLPWGIGEVEEYEDGAAHLKMVGSIPNLSEYVSWYHQPP
jgi:hypothetical protein